MKINFKSFAPYAISILILVVGFTTLNFFYSKLQQQNNKRTIGASASHPKRKVLASVVESYGDASFSFYKVIESTHFGQKIGVRFEVFKVMEEKAKMGSEINYKLLQEWYYPDYMDTSLKNYSQIEFDRSTNLALMDLDSDGLKEVLVPLKNKQGLEFIKVFTYDTKMGEFREFAPY